jgi:Cysteine dioxygenase type I
VAGAASGWDRRLGITQSSARPQLRVSRKVGAGGSRAFGPRYIHDVRNAATSALAVSVHAYSPPLPQMTRYDLTSAGLVKLDTGGAAAW